MEEGITEHLLQASGLTTLVDNRIQWDLRPQENALPAVTLSVITGTPAYSDEGTSGLTNTRLQIDCWAGDSTAAKMVARQVMAALADVEMEVLGIHFQAVYPDNTRDFVEREQGGKPIYRRSLDFDLWHSLTEET